MTAEQFYALVQEVALLRADVEHRRIYIDGRLAAAAKAVEVALDATDKRLNTMNEMRGALDDMSKQMITRIESETITHSIDQKFNGEVNELRTKIETHDRPNYLLGFTALSVGLVMIAGFWTVVGLKVESSISPLVVAVEQVKVGQLAQDREIALTRTRQDTFSTERRVENLGIGIAIAKLQAEIGEHAQ